MASDEGFEGYHVPQQSRRDKLRVVVAQNQLPHDPLLPFYDSSFITSFSNQHVLKPTSCSSSNNNSMKDLECSNFMMRFSREEGKRVIMNSNNNNNNNNISSSPSSSNHPYYESLNHSNNNPFLYQAQNIQNSSTMMLNHEPLSLSLSSNKSVGDNNLPLELNLQRYGSVIYGGGGVIQGLVEGGGGGGGSVPFTGYASVLKDSRFLKPAQELLEEMCDVGGRNVCGEKVVVMADSSMMMESPLERLSEEEDPFGDGRNKSRLLTMLDEVYKRYRQYYQQMQSVVTSFEYVSGLNNAAPYASLAIKAMSKHFRCLKKAITDQLQSNNKAHFHSSNRRDESPRFGNNERGGPYGHRSGYLEQQQQPVWRPQRGLPERAVTVLRAWLFEHFLHPYPTDTDKIMLAKQTGLSRSQVSNWFINARVRLWKPMVEEIHMLETRQTAPKDSQQKEENSRNKSNDQQHHLPSDTSLHSENPSTSTSKFHDASSYKRVVNEIPNMPSRTQGQQHQQPQQQQMNLPFQQVGVGVNMGSGSSSNNNNNSNSNVSLTLGLYQNHGIGLAEPFPLSAAQRFGLGLETNNEGNYVMSGFESQNRHFGGQMFHDFVG
ncbi:BEL1-like homeodomain protein 9 [Lathyrus oleraceus]|uniref:Homeobox domain-containing protein n=2 Tax=Pisum sativum TaxID=3888 RepID=A0A9D4VYQ6_PEA|nr:BEL1-like homeodomain protein 9 [Pisum sativum]KAI5391892.1 hypothetical protein KIW84_076624 [Pisum sativum]